MRKIMTSTVAVATVALASVMFSSPADAQWGTFKGKILLDGPIPDLKPLDTSGKDPAVCGAQPIPDEKLVVDPASKGIANVVVYLQKKPAKIHPSLEKSAEPSVAFDQKGCRFLPHILLVRTDQQVLVYSGDAVAHNTHTNPRNNTGKNFIVSPNDRTGVPIKEVNVAEKLPASVVCDIHPWMRAYWVILDHPYAAVTNEKGEFEIPNLPAGTLDFTIWQESSGYLEKKLPITITDGGTETKNLKYTASQILK